MISPGILMEMLHYNQVYNICIEITRIVGQGQVTEYKKQVQIKKRGEGKKTPKTPPKPLLLHRLGAELGCQAEGGRPATEGRGLTTGYPGDLCQPRAPGTRHPPSSGRGCYFQAGQKSKSPKTLRFQIA